MKNILLTTIFAVLTGFVVLSCEKYEEVPPRQTYAAKSYKLPDPEPLTQEDRDVISAQEKEYNENAK